MKKYLGITSIISIILIICFNLTFFKFFSIFSIISTIALGVNLIIFGLSYYTYSKWKQGTTIHIIRNILLVLISIPQILIMLVVLTFYIVNFPPEKSFDNKLIY